MVKLKNVDRLTCPICHSVEIKELRGNFALKGDTAGPVFQKLRGPLHLAAYCCMVCGFLLQFVPEYAGTAPKKSFEDLA